MGFALSDLQVSSPAFTQHGQIPRKHTGEGDDISPELRWEQAPAGTQSFAVFCHDPDAPLVSAGPSGTGAYGFVHWLLYNLPASVTRLAENDARGSVGANDFGSIGYGGPMPPEGHGPHQYYFWVLALDRELDLEPGLTLGAFLNRVEPHVLGMNRLVGRYERVR